MGPKCKFCRANCNHRKQLGEACPPLDRSAVIPRSKDKNGATTISSISQSIINRILDVRIRVATTPTVAQYVGIMAYCPIDPTCNHLRGGANTRGDHYDESRCCGLPKPQRDKRIAGLRDGVSASQKFPFSKVRYSC